MIGARTSDVLLGVSCRLTAFAVLGLLAFLCADLFSGGISEFSWQFFIEEPARSGRQGGIGPILVSTGWIVGVAMLLSLPLSFFAAAFLGLYSKSEARWVPLVQRALDVIAGVPSIVFGLFGSVVFCDILGFGFSIWSGSLTLTCMVLPLMIRSFEASLSAVPSSVRAGCVALGITPTAALFRVYVPHMIPGMVVGILLSFGRAIAETAALIFTSGYVTRWPTSLSDSGRSLSVHIYDLAMNVPGGDAKARATGLTLLMIVIGVSVVTHAIARRSVRRLQGLRV